MLATSHQEQTPRQPTCRLSTGVCLNSVGKVRHIHVNIFENRGEDLDLVDVDVDEDYDDDDEEDDVMM